jgi:hypothetical protein
MFGLHYFKVPTVISGAVGKLGPASVLRAATPSLGLRDRIKQAQGAVASLSPGAMSSQLGKVAKASQRHEMFSSVLKKKRFW